ncbi:MAG: GlsB/YeaQ/YmgE family stress response membrane protein [Candidatus Binataceae bacterium]
MISSIIVGLVAGWMAGKMMRGDGYGFVCDLLLGLVGGVVGGWMFGAFGIHPHHMIGAIIVATLGASALVFAARAATGELFED